MADNIILKKKANLFRGIESVGGHIFITEKKLIFAPHAINFQTQDEEFLIENILSIKPYNLMLVIRNGVNLEMKTEYGSKVHRFVTQDRDEVIAVINGLICTSRYKL